MESILAQDFRDLELIVSDNASTDRTGQIVAEFARRDERIRYVRSETNVGAAANYNRPVELARGAYFKWAADDDLIAPTYLSSCVAVLDADPGVVLAYGGTRLIDEAGDPIGDHRDGMHLPFPEPWRRMRAFAAHRWLCNPCFGVIRTDVLRDATTLIAPSDSSDVTFLAQVALAGRVHEVPDRLFFRRVTRDSRGLGEQSDGQAAQWFGSAAPRKSGVAPMARVFVDIERWILRSDLPLPDKARTVAAFTYAWLKRQAGITLWRWRRRLRGGRTRSFVDGIAQSKN
ncbi:glycosyltransferase family 2 protein [Jiangella alba]|uniref:glycosyltransferase family 2 protein n=1 Tax=Jiangella alba TaxID=561176 RepID=UPI001FE1A8EB|nr:glycosyltransferase [Jiangella alba]